jgi:hypothetical protein
MDDLEEFNGAPEPPRKPTVREVNPLTAPRARAFRLVREEDETGISGTGVVAEGVEFSNGMCAMCWLTAMHSVAVYPNIRQLEAIHGHNGRARVVFEQTQPADFR